MNASPQVNDWGPYLTDTAEAPAPEWSARRFAVWWLRHKPFKVPQADGVRAYDGVYGLTLYRHGQFQAQLFIVSPNSGSPTHCHPNIDSVEYGLAGAGTFSSDRNLLLSGLLMVAPGENHTAAAGPLGGAFISLQKWLNGVPPTSVEMDWMADAPIDAKHAEAIGGR
jgi:quercetin dioxygenase-like cupin family protein